MAFEQDPNKRREQREKLRQQRLAENRSLMLKLILAGVVLVLCGVLIFLVAGRNGGTQTTDPVETTTAPVEMEQSTAESTTEATDISEPDTTGETSDATTGETGTTASTGNTEGSQPATTPSVDDSYTVIHFAAGGDVNVSDTTVASDFELAFRDILPLLSGADLAAVNFEGNLVGEPYGSQYASAPQTLMTALRNAGVDLIQMANSYAIYNGLDGLNSTLSGIRTAGLEPVGAWATAAEAQESGGYTIREINGVKVAVVAFTKGMNSMALPAGSEGCVNVLYEDYATTYKKVDTEGITAVLNRVAEEEPDITIALVHWGSEYRDLISDTQTKIKNLLLSLGVDAIIGTHPHYVQAMEYDPEAGTFVCYSLGDLLSDGTTRGTEYSVLLDLEITKDNISGETRITGYSYTPLFTVHEEGQPLRVLRLDEAVAAYEEGYMFRVSAGTYDDMLYARSRIEARVVPEDK